MAEGLRENAIAILGGTGDQGLGLALRFAAAGRFVRIGSRALERAEEAARKVRKAVPAADVVGLANRDAAAGAPIVILSVPFENTAGTLMGVAGSITAGQIVVSMGVPLATAIGNGATRILGVWQGSCAEMVKALVPKGVQVVSAFQNVSSHRLRQLEETVECDVVVCGPEEARRTVMELCRLVPGLRGVDGGPLANARIVEAITALMIGINVRYELPEGTGIRFTGLPER